jgi:hypothetical protein
MTTKAKCSRAKKKCRTGKTTSRKPTPMRDLTAVYTSGYKHTHVPAHAKQTKPTEKPKQFPCQLTSFCRLCARGKCHDTSMLVVLSTTDAYRLIWSLTSELDRIPC